MGRRATIDIATVSKGRTAWLKKSMQQVRTDCASAREGKSWSAVAALHRQEQQLRAEYDAERAAQAARAEEEANRKASAADMTPDEWRMRVEADARASTDDDLDIVMQVWMERNGVVMVHEGADTRLVRRSA